MYSKNITTFLSHLLGKDGAKKAALELDTSDEITRETLLTRDGDVVHARVRELLGAAAR
jgi:NAD/NADP transhydrogenase alpha subunit